METTEESAAEPTPENETGPTAPRNVIEALARVQAEIGGIAKVDSDKLKYKIRGIDQICAAAQPLLGRYGVVIVPTVLDQTVLSIVVNGNPWTDTEVIVRWRLFGPGGVNDMIESETRGLGRDSSDKGINKAMTGAFKNLLLRVLCIGDPADDTDGHTHEADAPMKTDRSKESLEVYDALVELDRDSPLVAEIKTLATDEGKKLTAMDFDRDSAWRDQVKAVLAKASLRPANIDADGVVSPGNRAANRYPQAEGFDADPPEPSETDPVPPDASETVPEAPAPTEPEPDPQDPTDQPPETHEKADDSDDISTPPVDDEPEPADR